MRQGFDSVADDGGVQHPPPHVFRGDGGTQSPPSHVPLTKQLRAPHTCRLRHHLQSPAQASQPSCFIWEASLAAP